MKSRWWILIFSILALLCLSFVLFLPGSRGGTSIGVFQDGVLLRRIDLSALSQGYTFTVRSPWGENQVRVEADKVYIISADCPDGSCLRQAPLPESGRPIVCLPHRLVLRNLGEDEAPYDAIAGVAG